MGAAEDRWRIEGKWGNLTRHLEALLRLRSFPIGFKFLEDENELRKSKWVRRPDKEMTLSQLTTIVRTFDWTVGVTKDNLNPHCANMLGMVDLPENMADGTMRSITWCRNKEDGKKCEDSIAKLPRGKFNALIIAPLAYNPFEPDLILIFGNPAQMLMLISAIQLEKYEMFQYFFVGEGSGFDSAARCYLTGKPSLTIPCYGERRFGHVQDDELEIAIPPEMFEKIVHRLEDLYKKGVRYPIAYYGAEGDVSEGYRKVYPDYY